MNYRNFAAVTILPKPPHVHTKSSRALPDIPELLPLNSGKINQRCFFFRTLLV